MIEDRGKGLLIVGAGGHALVVLSVAIACSEKVYGYVDDNPALLNQVINHYPVLGDTSLLETDNIKYAVCGLGDNSKRKSIYHQFRKVNAWKTLIHPTAYVHPSVEIGEGSVIFAGAIIQPNARIGRHCIINTGATVDHDSIIEDFVHIAPGVHLAGGVRVNEGAFLGIGSIVIPRISIGHWAQVAAGAVVVQDISDKQKVMGVPAKEKQNER